MWGLGATLYNMVVGQPPWMADNELELAETVRNMELTYPDNTQYIDPHLKNLLARMLDKDPDTRLSMDMVYTHDWVTSEGSEPLDETPGSSETSTRPTTGSSTPARQTSSSSSTMSSSMASLAHGWPGRHRTDLNPNFSMMSMESDAGSSSLSINLPRNNSHTRKISSSYKKLMRESVMILADNMDSSCASSSPVDSERSSMPSSPGIASRRPLSSPLDHRSPLLTAGSGPSPLAEDPVMYKHWSGQMGNSSSTIATSSPDEHDRTHVSVPKDFNENRSLKSTKMTRMTSSNIITHTGELRKALKIVAPIAENSESNHDGYNDYDDYDSNSDLSDDDEDFFERSSPPPMLVDPVLPSSMNPLELRSKSNLDECQLALDMSEDELLGKHTTVQVTVFIALPS